MIRAFAALIAFAVAVPAFAADEKFDADKLVGTWKLTKSKSLPEGATATVVYSKDGTVAATIELKGMKIELKGTWKIDGNKLLITTKEDNKDKVDTDTILKLTADELVTKNKDDEEDAFTKVKEDKK